MPLTPERISQLRQIFPSSVGDLIDRLILQNGNSALVADFVDRLARLFNADSVGNGDLLLGVNAQNKEKLYPAITFKGADGAGISGIVKTETLPSGDEVYQISYTDNRTPTQFTLKKGAKGDKGDTGDGFAIRRIFDSAIAMTTAAASIVTGAMVAVLTGNGADIYIRNPEQTAGGKHYAGFTFFTTLSDASVIRGEKGDTGEKGDKGDTPTLSIGTVTTIDDIASASAEITPDGKLNLSLPRGHRGLPGNDGRSITSLSLEDITESGETVGHRLTIIYNGETFTADIMNGTGGGGGGYTPPVGGIPKTDLAADVQTSLEKADTALQSHQSISGKEDKTNKLASNDNETTITAISNDTSYPTAKNVWLLFKSLDDAIGAIINPQS